MNESQEKPKIKSFTDLNAWRESHKLAIAVYKMTKTFPKEEIYSLVDQMRRAVIPLPQILRKVSVDRRTRKKYNFTT